MHPPLHVNKHPSCKDVIEALQACHKNNPIAKFGGVCNDQKLALDRCFRQEKVERRSKNFQTALEERQRLEARLAERGHSGRVPGFGAVPKAPQ